VVESHYSFDPGYDVEALVRAAGNYVQPSDDLRPRVVEAVRSRRVERTTQRRIWQVAILSSVLSILATSTLQRVQIADGNPTPIVSRSIDSSSGTAEHHDQGNWGVVDSFRELRRRQAKILRLHL
jgi:hypothetical protein